MLARRIVVVSRQKINCSLVWQRWPSSSNVHSRKARSFGSGSSSEDPDEFRGPGGLTARQIFQKVQDSADRDALYAKKMVDELEEEYSASAATSNDVETTQRDPMDMSVRQLKQVLDAKAIDHSDYYEKSDLVQLVRDIMNSSNKER